MDIIEIPSHFMENFLNDARTIPLFMPSATAQSAAQTSEMIARQILQDRHMFGALDLEMQASHPTVLLVLCTAKDELVCMH